MGGFWGRNCLKCLKELTALRAKLSEEEVDVPYAPVVLEGRRALKHVVRTFIHTGPKPDGYMYGT